MYYFFGASQNCYAAVRFFGKENVLAIIDNNERKVGTLYEKIEIISFDEFLKRWNGEKIIITAFAAGKEIVKQLEDHKIENYFECPYIRTSFFTCEEMINMWNLLEYDSYAVLGGNPISDTLLARIKNKNPNCRVRMISDVTADCSGDVDIIMNMKENFDLPVSGDNKIKIINFWADVIRETESKYWGLSRYKGVHNDERCFLIGNGPSLTNDDLNKIADYKIPSFGCNKIYLIFPNIRWRPTYYVVVDDNVYRSSAQYVDKYRFTAFVRDFFGTVIEKSDRINLFRSLDERYESGYPNFSTDLTKGLYGGRTVMYAMLQIAVYMGFKEIYLLGVDFSWGENGTGTHFYESHKDDMAVRDSVGYKKEVQHAYISAKNYADVHGIKIYNVTRGGDLDVFERLDIDKLFEELE